MKISEGQFNQPLAFTFKMIYLHFHIVLCQIQFGKKPAKSARLQAIVPPPHTEQAGSCN